VIYYTGVNVFTDYLHVYSFIHYLLLPLLLLAIHIIIFSGFKGFILKFKTSLRRGLISIIVVISLGFILRIVVNNSYILEYLSQYSPYAIGSLISSRFFTGGMLANILHMDNAGLSNPGGRGPAEGSYLPPAPRGGGTYIERPVPFPLQSDLNML
jgi:hypothetical protein